MIYSGLSNKNKLTTNTDLSFRINLHFNNMDFLKKKLLKQYTYCKLQCNISYIRMKQMNWIFFRKDV